MSRLTGILTLLVCMCVATVALADGRRRGPRPSLEERLGRLEAQSYLSDYIATNRFDPPAA